MTDVTFKRVERQPVYQQVADQIREAILSGSMTSGSTLPSERQLQKTFGVGRTTVREALRALEAQGFLSGGDGNWRTVTEPTLDGPLREALVQLMRLQRVDLDDLVDLRLILETAAVERAVAAADHDALAGVREHLESMRRPGISVGEYQEADMRFHVTLAQASGNEALHLVMLTLREVIGRYMLAMNESVRDLERRLPSVTADHAAILEAVERGDVPAAVEHTKRHLLGSHELLRRWVEQASDAGVTLAP